MRTRGGRRYKFKRQREEDRETSKPQENVAVEKAKSREHVATKVADPREEPTKDTDPPRSTTTQEKDTSASSATREDENIVSAQVQETTGEINKPPGPDSAVEDTEALKLQAEAKECVAKAAELKEKGEDADCFDPHSVCCNIVCSVC